MQQSSADVDAIEGRESGPHRKAERGQAEQILFQVLEHMDEDKREVFILAELEEMTAGQIAEALGTNETTVYARLRDARRKFKVLAQRFTAGSPGEGEGR
jgi:RNA polymerase sigma-70 factor (ECF subfamily)